MPNETGGEFYILEHHLRIVRLESDSNQNLAPGQIADSWIESVVDRIPRYRTLSDPQARQGMRNGFSEHIKALREGKKPITVDNSDPLLDPICSACISESCCNSRAGMKLLKNAGLI